MIFLNPAVLFGLLAASIPVLIHLLNLRKLKRIEFSTLAFLKELQKNKIRKLKLKQWLLLTLRVLIILFLVAAFARPTLEGVALGGTTSAAKTTAVFILDDTYSMSVVDGNGSYFNQAKQIINKMVEQLQEGDEAALVVVSDNGEGEIKTTSNLIDFKDKVKNSDISAATGMLHNSIIKAAEILDKSQNFNKEIYLLSDFQSKRLADEKSLSDLSSLLNENIKFYSFDLSGKNVFNAAVDEIKVNTQIFEKNKPVEFNVTVTNYSDQSITDGLVSLYLNGDRSSQQSINIGAGESKIVSMEAVVKSTGFINAFAEIEEDEIELDNKRFTNFYVPEKIPVIIFADKQSDGTFVELALSASDNNKVIDITTKNTSQLSSYNLNNYDVVFVIGTKELTNIERLKTYINSGGGTFIMPGSNSEITSFNNFLSEIDIPSASNLIGKKNRIENAVTINNVQIEHPVFQNIFLERTKKEFESPEIYHYYRLTGGGRGLDVITLIDGSAFLSEFKSNSGKTFLLNISPVLSWSNFPLKSIFVPLINKSVYYLAAKSREDVKIFAGEKMNINLNNITTPKIKIVQPDNQEVFLNADETQSSNYITFSETKTSGNYEIYSGESLIDLRSVNTLPVESNIEYLSNSDFEDYLSSINFSGTHLRISKDDNPEQIVIQARFGSELWKYFLLFALLLALIEMTIARNAKKELAEVK